jgi:hypothetical protein
MQAIKLHARVDRDRRLSLQLPEDVPEGDVEVIVLAPARPDASACRQHLERLLDRLATNPRARLSKEQIDAQLAEERASWER